MSANTFYAGFASYYEAGVSGMDMEQRSAARYGAQLSAAQKYAAYVAGRNDAELSHSKESGRLRLHKSAGNDSGLVYDDFVRQAVESGRVMNDVNGETGCTSPQRRRPRSTAWRSLWACRCKFVDNVRGGTANARIQRLSTVVERNNPNPVMAIVGHEMTHRMQELAPQRVPGVQGLLLPRRSRAASRDALTPTPRRAWS